MPATSVRSDFILLIWNNYVTLLNLRQLVLLLKNMRIALDNIERNGEEAASERHAFILELYKEMQGPVLMRD
ncbi:Cytochrome P450 E-class CYP52 [Penicillium concentricum]|uniref:Cytochrome P450 E-class CYP52 n=1 Tax=Penicillium concentricum TaxID=293559 RepID=A0A9W9RV17_9EURO|nr:Cytochrome P450 E-class CYP52 [Penicillium concentricum]KAJ5365789.1 Cytochrome P450 E-class CYP52 [Penicillium concentricum]